MSKEPYSYGKRDLLHTNETYRYTGRPEVCMNIKRGILIWQKSPIHMAKETPTDRLADLSGLVDVICKR